MAQKYFRYVPNFEYVSRTNDKSISDYTNVKNLFKRVKLREDIFQDLTYFTKYQVIGDNRPDNVAHEVYDDANYDWLVMLSNNIVNLETEWPMSQESFEKYLLNKYGSYENLYNIKHYETSEIVDSRKRIIVPKGLIVPSDYSITYFDTGLNQYVTRSGLIEVTNYNYELNLQNEKRNIFLLKPYYISLVLDDLDRLMPYSEGSSQYVSDSLVRGENIRLYQ